MNWALIWDIVRWIIFLLWISFVCLVTSASIATIIKWAKSVDGNLKQIVNILERVYPKPADRDAGKE